MAENLGQIDVVIKNDSQTLSTPTVGPSGGGEPGGPNALPGAARTASQGGFGGGLTRGIGFAALGAGLALGALALAAGMATKKFQKWDGQIEVLTSQLAYLSSHAAMAGVIKQMGTFRRDLKAASILGPTIMNIARLKEAVKDNLHPLKMFFANLKAEVVENVWAAFVLATENMDSFVIALEKATEYLTDNFTDPKTHFEPMVENVHDDSLWGIFRGSMNFALGVIAVKTSELVEEVKKTKEEIKERDMHAEAREHNGNLLRTLEQLTSNQWTYSTQMAGTQATGQQLGNPAAQPKAPSQPAAHQQNRKKRSGRTRFGS